MHRAAVVHTVGRQRVAAGDGGPVVRVHVLQASEAAAGQSRAPDPTPGIVCRVVILDLKHG